MTNVLRAFIGSDELQYEILWMEKSSEHYLDKGRISIVPNSNVTESSFIDIRAADGLTSLFRPAVVGIKRDKLWQIDLIGRGRELSRTYYENTYTNKSPEFILNDIITNHTDNLTFASPISENNKIDYVAQGYLIDIVKDMMDLLSWRIRIDANLNFYFESNSVIDNGKTWSHGEDVQVLNWEQDPERVVNHVRVLGGFEDIFTTENLSGNSQQFTLTYAPTGTFRVTLPDTTEVPPTGYIVKAADKRIVFLQPRTNPTVQYTYRAPVVVSLRNDVSIRQYGESYKEISLPWLDDFRDARRYAKTYLQQRSDSTTRVNVVRPLIDNDVELNELITIHDDLNGLTSKLFVNSIRFTSEGFTKISLGTREFSNIDWQDEVQTRIKNLEKRAITNISTNFVRSTSLKTRAKYKVKIRAQVRDLNKSFVLGHPINGRLRNITGLPVIIDVAKDLGGNENLWHGKTSTANIVYDHTTKFQGISSLRCNNLSHIFIPETSGANDIKFNTLRNFTFHIRITNQGTTGFDLISFLDRDIASVTTTNMSSAQVKASLSVLGNRKLRYTFGTSTFDFQTLKLNVWYTVSLYWDNTLSTYVVTTENGDATTYNEMRITLTYPSGVKSGNIGYKQGTGTKSSNIDYRLDDFYAFDSTLLSANELISQNLYEDRNPTPEIRYSFDENVLGDFQGPKRTIFEEI